MDNKLIIDIKKIRLLKGKADGIHIEIGLITDKEESVNLISALCEAWKLLMEKLKEKQL